MDIYLQRIHANEKGVVGALSFEGNRPFTTLELPWRNNRRECSCIPAGDYLCRAHYSPKYGPTWEICDIPNRDSVIFHWGNFLHNTLGCVLVGYSYDEVLRFTEEYWLHSPTKDAFQEFQTQVLSAVGPSKNFTLKIRWPGGLAFPSGEAENKERITSPSDGDASPGEKPKEAASKQEGAIGVKTNFEHYAASDLLKSFAHDRPTISNLLPQ